MNATKNYEMNNFNKEKYSQKGVYSIENIITKECYIGSTTMSFKRRFLHHRSELRRNNHKNNYLQNSWNKHGENNFEFNILEVTENTLKVEQKYLDVLNPKYNINPIASGTPNMSKETIAKRAKTFKNTTSKASEYYRKVKNKILTLEEVPEKYRKLVKFRLNYKVWNKGLTKKDIDYSYLKVPKTKTKKLLEARAKIDKERRDKGDNILVFDLNHNLLKEFNSVHELCEFSKTDKNNLPIKSRFKKDRMGIPIKELINQNIYKACSSGKPYKGLYFSKKPNT